MSLFADPPRHRRRPSLTPMIDVVFLLLVFFMLASRFGLDSVIDMTLAAGGGTYDGPPRLVEVLPEGLRLNGIAIDDGALNGAMERLTTSPDDVIVLRGGEGTTLQRIVTIGGLLREGGHPRTVLIE